MRVHKENKVAHKQKDAMKFKTNGNNAFHKQRYDEAWKEYTKAIELKVEDDSFVAILYCNRAAASLALRKFVDAVSDCNMAIALDPSYTRALHRRADALASLGDYSSALRDMNRVPENSLTAEQQSKMRELHRRSKRGNQLDPYLILGKDIGTCT